MILYVAEYLTQMKITPASSAWCRNSDEMGPTLFHNEIIASDCSPPSFRLAIYGFFKYSIILRHHFHSLDGTISLGESVWSFFPEREALLRTKCGRGHNEVASYWIFIGWWFLKGKAGWGNCRHSEEVCGSSIRLMLIWYPRYFEVWSFQ